MEYRIQDILKNLIPGFILLLGFYLLNKYYNVNFDLRRFSGDVDKDILLLILPFLFYILGYINDIFSSFIEYQFYSWGVFKRPSFMLLNNKFKRYRLANLSVIRREYPPNEGDNRPYDKNETYNIFKVANQKKHDNIDNKNEFYMSYIFARNLMSSMFIIMILAIVFGVINNVDFMIILKATLLSFLLLSLFIYRWRQKAIYYSIKILNSI